MTRLLNRCWCCPGTTRNAGGVCHHCLETGLTAIPDKYRDNTCRQVWARMEGNPYGTRRMTKKEQYNLLTKLEVRLISCRRPYQQSRIKETVQDRYSESNARTDARDDRLLAVYKTIRGDVGIDAETIALLVRQTMAQVMDNLEYLAKGRFAERRGDGLWWFCKRQEKDDSARGYRYQDMRRQELIAAKGKGRAA